MTATILFEGQHLLSETPTGLARYTRDTAATAGRMGYRTQLLLGTPWPTDGSGADMFSNPVERVSFVARAIRRGWAWAGAPFGIRPSVVDLPAGRREARGLAGFHSILAAPMLYRRAAGHVQRYGTAAPLRMARPPDLFHAPYPAPLRLPGRKNIVTIHDLIPMRLPGSTPDDLSYFERMVRCVVQEADHIVTVSEFSRREIIELLDVPEDKVTNTYQGAALTEAVATSPSDELAKLGLIPGEFFLFVGNIEPRKNLMRLVNAYLASGSLRPLVVAGGRGWLCEDVVARLTAFNAIPESSDAGPRVRWLSHVPDATLVSLIQNARGLLQPSLYEGFGLPVLEAMALGTAVVTSTASSLSEIAGDAALLVDPHDVADIAGAIGQLDRDDACRARLAAAGRVRAGFFSRANYEKRLGDVYGRVLGMA